MLANVLPYSFAGITNCSTFTDLYGQFTSVLRADFPLPTLFDSDQTHTGLEAGVPG